MDSPQVPGTAGTSSSDISDLTSRMPDFLRKNTNTPNQHMMRGNNRTQQSEAGSSEQWIRHWLVTSLVTRRPNPYGKRWPPLTTMAKTQFNCLNSRKKVNQTKQNGGIIDQYFGTLQGYWREIDLRRPNLMKTDKDIHTYNQIIQEERLYIFLDGLDDKLDATRRDILNTHPIPSLAEAYAMVRREIRRQTVMNDGGIPDQMAGGVGLAMKSRSDSQSSPREFFSASPWNKSGNNKRNANAQKCEHCGGSKHTKETCFKIYGFPEWWSEYQNKKKGDSGKVAVSAASGNTENVASGGWKPQSEGTEQRQAQAAVLIGTEQTEEATGGKARELRVALISQKDKNAPLFCDTMGQLIYDDLGSVNRFSRPGIKIAGSFSGLNTIANGPELLSNILHCRPEISNSDYIAMGSNATVSIETNLSQSDKGEEWILDSGATDHMTFSRQDISQITQPRKSSVFNANGIPYPVSGAGSIELTHTLKLSNVLLVPSLSNKLLSVSQVTKELNCTVLMLPLFCLLQDIRTREIIGRGTERDGLYYMDDITRTEVGSPEYVTVQSENNPTGPGSTSSSHIIDIVQSFSPGQLDTPQPSPDTNDHEVSIPEPSPEPEYTIESIPLNPTGYVLPQRINRGIPPKSSRKDYPSKDLSRPSFRVFQFLIKQGISPSFVVIHAKQHVKQVTV
ncbi:hypothetical protein ACH5RR_030353 [Cinchona calisaya]|uniref:Retrovirus-related Pol polyprotein from transposon TNT 1-94-like beta-barrel domain-containing protein n=1 Tax=Cinchona calisaya TaxID=153742 RepID=A0ABD2YXK6_9GENT